MEDICYKTKGPGTDTDSLDLGPALRWYSDNSAELTARLESSPERAIGPCEKRAMFTGFERRKLGPYFLRCDDHYKEADTDLGMLINLFPDNARARSILRSIVGKPYTWFWTSPFSMDGDTDPTTTEKSKAISPTHIVPGRTDYTRWKETGKRSADIFLYDVPDVSPQVKRIVQAQAFVHELGHTIVDYAAIGEFFLELPDKTIISGRDALLEFKKLTESRKPVSHYASFYRNEDNGFKDSFNPGQHGSMENQFISVSEELMETIAAMYLGFAFCADENGDPDQERAMDPMADRKDAERFVKDFLQARLLSRE